MQTTNASDLYSVKLLLVDDHPANLVALSAVLDRPDYECVLASSGREALSILLKDQDFALILLDVQMPEMNGFETASMIRQYEKTSDIPVIFITAAYTSFDDMMKGYDLNAVDYILKPFNTQILKKKVSVIIELHRRTQQTLKELEELKKMSGVYPSDTPKNLQYSPLQKSSNTEFIKLMKEYEQILELAVNEQIYQKENSHTKLLKHFTKKLFGISATPRDLIELHLSAVESVQLKNTGMPKNAYIEEGRMLLLEAMGELTSFYRQHCLPLRENSPKKEI